MNQTLIIKNIAISENDESRTISADVGDDYIWFKASRSVPMRLSAEPFIAVALLEAMFTGKTIEVIDGLPVSKQFFESLTEIQSVFHCWNEDLTVIDVLAQTKSEQECSGKIASFFSAGVDSSHTFCRHLEEITHLVLMDAFDEQCSQEEWQRYLGKQQDFAKTYGKELLFIESNVRQFSEKKEISWEFMHGPVLCSIGNFFGFDKIYVPSSYTYRELFAWGSHPLTDPMWSTEGMRVVHDGSGERRWEKVKSLTNNQVVLDNLHVCWRSKIDNCGDCPKCIRTMIALHLLKSGSQSVPQYQNISQLKKLKAADDHDAAFLEDAMLMAEFIGDNDIYRKLRWYFKKYQLLQFLEYTDKLLLGGLMRKIYRRLSKPKWLNSRVILGTKY